MATARLTNSLTDAAGQKSRAAIGAVVSPGVTRYVVRDTQGRSNTRNVGNILNIGERLRSRCGLCWNSGSPESRKAGGLGGAVVLGGRWVSTATRKGSRPEVSRDSKLAGSDKLERLQQQIVKKGAKGTTGLTDIMSDPLFLEASYHRLKSKPGMLTPGTDRQTVDAISKAWFERTSHTFRNGIFTFKPVRRVEIPKANGGVRYLGVPSPRDRIVMDAMRALLELIFEPEFSDTSHGFRPGRGSHTALNHIKMRMGYVTWFIEGDISKCFDSINQPRLMAIIKVAVQDQAFIDLIYKALRAGYIHPQPTEIGTPQGGTLSPLLANIYLDALDK